MSIEITSILADVWFQRLDSAVAEKRILIIAEAYANARVREALEEAAMTCWEMQSKPEYGKDDKDRWLAIAEQRIRALIPRHDND